MAKQNPTGVIHASMYRHAKQKGHVAPVDVLLDIGVLSQKGYESWRFGRVDYLERVCTVNLHKLSEIMKTMRQFARKNGWKPSWTFYRQWACKTTRKLRFSKSGDEAIEKSYATHFVTPKDEV